MPSRAVSYSPDGSKIAVGFGTPVRESSKQFDGKWIVLQEDDFQVCGWLFEYDSCLKPFPSRVYTCVYLSFTFVTALLEDASADETKCASVECLTPHPVSWTRTNISYFVHVFAVRKVLHAARDSQKHITDIKWAPSGQSLAMGSADGKIYVYRWVAVCALDFFFSLSQHGCAKSRLHTTFPEGNLHSFVVHDHNSSYFSVGSDYNIAVRPRDTFLPPC